MFTGGNPNQPGDPSQGGGAHPTVPYGQPQTPNQAPPPPSFMQGGQQMQQQVPQQAPQPSQQVPHQTAPYGQFPQQQLQGQPQGQPAAPSGFNDEMILDGPNVPAELRGRTFGQFKSIYSALANEWLQRNNRGQGQGQQPQPQPTHQQQPTPQPHVAGRPNQGQPSTGWDWTNPREAIAGTVREVVGEVLQPVIQNAQGNAILQARQVAMQQIPDFAQLEGTVVQKLSSVDPAALSSPEVWINAARLARGELVERGQYNHTFNRGGDPNQPGQFQQQGVAQHSPAQRSPAQPYQFFTEAPTPPAGGGFNPGTLSQDQMSVAQKMGMTPEQYLHWSGGIRR